jgi:hypothetical protein
VTSTKLRSQGYEVALLGFMEYMEDLTHRKVQLIEWRLATTFRVDLEVMTGQVGS